MDLDIPSCTLSPLETDLQLLVPPRALSLPISSQHTDETQTSTPLLGGSFNNNDHNRSTSSTSALTTSPSPEHRLPIATSPSANYPFRSSILLPAVEDSSNGLGEIDGIDGDGDGDGDGDDDNDYRFRSTTPPTNPSQLRFMYNNHNELIFDDQDLFPALNPNSSIVKFDDVNNDLINHATLKALVVQLTLPEIIDYNLICDFFLTYRTFVSSVEVMNLLLTRLIWALQYINSQDVERNKIGKLVLLRTFVVLRHWVLNYFVDDFQPDSQICDLFTLHLNEIIGYLNFLPNLPEMLFERKIISDLKIHWIRQVNDFWGFDLEVDTLLIQSVLAFPLPLTAELQMIPKKMSKSTTDMSIHTNPSYRRLAMLLLYDHKTYQKCLIYQDGSGDENPQLLINNLLLQHKSLRASINIQIQVLQQKSKRANERRQAPNPAHDQKGENRIVPTSSIKHNFISLQDSSVALKKTVRNDDSTTPSGLAPPIVIDSSSLSTPLKHTGPSTLDPADVSVDNGEIDSNVAANGFSTNGNIKVPSLKVEGILPPTPVKKMDYIIRNDPVDASHILMPPGCPHSEEDNDIARKSSIKKILNGWRKTFIQPSNADFHPASPTSPTSPTSSHHLNHMISTAFSELANDADGTIGTRVDVLSARIIDELEHLIRFCISNEHTPITILEAHQDDLDSRSINVNLPRDSQGLYGSQNGNFRRNYDGNEGLRRHDHNEMNLDDGEELPEHNIDIGDLSDLNIMKIDNLINERSAEGDSKELSFQRPISINWNDEKNLEFDNSDSNVNDGISLKDVNFETTAMDDVSLEVVNIDDGGYSNFAPSTSEKSLEYQNGDNDNRFGAGHQLFSNARSKSTTSLVNNSLSARSTKMEDRLQKSSTQYFDLSTDFDTEAQARSNNSFNSSISTPSNLTQYDADVAELGILTSPQDKNQQHLHPKRISFNEANISHNQKRLSTLSRTSSSSIFKRDSVKSYISYDSVFSSSNVSGKINTGQAAIENNGFLRKKAGFNNLRGGEYNKDQPTSKRASVLRDSFGSHVSHLSRASSVRKSVRLSTLCALTELPFNFFDDGDTRNESNLNYALNKRSMKSTKLLEVCDSSIFSVAIKSRLLAKDKSNSSSNNSAAIPGISNCILKELAAIPDESFRFSNPVDTAFEKLEGKGKLVPTKNVGDDTQEILDEINNAQTLDVINLVDSFDSSQEEQPLSPGMKEEYMVSRNSILTNESDNETVEMQCSTPMMMSDDRIDQVDMDRTPQNTKEDPKREFDFKKPELFTKELDLSYLSPKAILDKYAMSSEILSVENVLQSNHHVSFVLSYDSKTLAQHFTMIEQDILQEIDWKELIELKWNKELEPVNSWLEVIVNDSYFNQNKGVNLVISRFNLMVNWIISQILLTKNIHERIFIISRFIHIAQNCLVMQNFATLMQIILGLTSEKVSKLKETWKNLPPGDILMLKNLEDIGSPLKNFLNIRLCINQMTPSKGCIPFVGLYLSDLIFNAERPAFIKQNNGNMLQLSESDEKFINFSRFRTSVHIVKSLSQCIEWSCRYDIHPRADLLSKCLYVRSLDEEEMNYCLEQIDERVISEDN